MRLKINKWFLGTIVAGLLIVGYYAASAAMPGKYDELAKCMTEKGVMFYGAYWCPHCQEQKESFGKSMKYITYVECSYADSNGKPKDTQVCLDANITSYPTWEFEGGRRQTGAFPPESLAQLTACKI